MLRVTQNHKFQTKPPLDHENLRHVIDVSLWAGQMLLQSGAESQQVEETIHRLGTALGCDWMDIFVSPNVLIISTIHNDEFRTKARRIVDVGVNLGVATEINALVQRAIIGELTCDELRDELERVSSLERYYSRWMVALMVGVACGAFARLFGGDWIIFMITFIASGTAMVVKQQLHHYKVNPFLTVVVTAFTASLLAGTASIFRLGNEPRLALIASVLLLVPGVPLIHSVQDLMKGYVVTGISRGIVGGVIAACIALGLLLAVTFLGVNLQ